MKENLFIAIKVDVAPSLLKLVRNTQSLLKKERVRWVPDTELCIKLAQINDLGMKKSKVLIEKLEESLNSVHSFSTSIKGVGNVGSNFIYAGVEHTDEFQNLREKIASCLAEFIDEDTSKLIPNILLARVNTIHDKRKFHKLIDMNRTAEFDSLEVKDVCLMSTELKAYGPVASVEKSIDLTEEEELEEEVA
ncbi:MAG: hypothetical protein N4A32_09570 [Marinifilaceae bacterium]|jgi:2'-5' RNA ligase|nr:hypothetical protein [Marinifilaceae bacterium]